jgi:hypothetical protein
MSLLADNPDQISWLTALEKRLLRARIAEKQTSVSEGRRLSMLLELVSIFWRLPTATLSSTAAVAGVAWVNPVGNGAGYLTPFPNGRRSISGMT